MAARLFADVRLVADTRLFAEDIRSLDASAVRAELGLERHALALIQACPPCQTWSSLGAAMPDDPRNELVLDVARFIGEFLPRAFVVENVPGLAKDFRLIALVARARALGYGVKSYVVDAADFGVPQRRRRLIVVGVAGIPENELPASLLDAPRRTIRSIVGDDTARPQSSGWPRSLRAAIASIFRRIFGSPVTSNWHRATPRRRTGESGLKNRHRL